MTFRRRDDVIIKENVLKICNTSKPSYNDPKKVINCAKFNVCTAGSFGGVKTDILTDRQRKHTQTELCFTYSIVLRNITDKIEPSP